MLIIEEAHGLPATTLKHLKRFRELKDGHASLLSIILIGQPELMKTLNPSRMSVREVVQRCDVHMIEPLGADLEKYIEFKFNRVGKKADSILSADAYDAIRQRLSSGPARNKNEVPISFCYPLAVNNLITLCLNSAADIAQKTIDKALILNAN